MPKYLVIVESPAKCKTISKFLGKDYELTASFGHVRDLPGKKLGVDIDNDFEPSYQNMKEKSAVIKQISSSAKKSDIVYIATDPDREGEAIAWHIVHATKLPKDKIRRIVFNEITETAVQDAIQHCRDIDTDLVDAQQARRVLDRLIGYKLSPVLSRKIQKGLSAGRVQSVAVKIICDREKEIQAFEPKEYWVIETEHKTSKKEGPFTAKLIAKDSLDNKFEATNESEATTVKKDLESSTYSVADVIKTRITRKPALPFITSTLQQEASRKLNWPAKRTMRIAQQLYEGIDINGEATGLITYMRTDSTRISNEATEAAKEYILKQYSKEYLGTQPAKKATKKNIQDAHEAIRPVHIEHNPNSIKEKISDEQFKLYTLIFNRFIASQMSAAKYDRTQVVIEAKNDNTPYFLRASGSILVFDGFTKIYTEGLDDKKQDENKEKKLPAIEKKEALSLENVETEQKFTQPPSRYTEATLVKTLEELGIGRPSTYAPTLSTIQDRGYIDMDSKRLVPSELGMVTNDQLESFFESILDLKFTANLEKQLDEIQDGKHNWKSIVSTYYSPLTSMIENANKNMERVSVGERILGMDPKTGKEVLVKIGRYGPMAQIGKATDEDKPLFAGLNQDQDIKTISLEEALKLFDFPKTLGQFEDEDIIVNKGRFGPYVKIKNSFVSIPKEISMNDITLDQAIELIKEKRKQEKEKVIQEFTHKDVPIQILNGRYGPYITSKKKNYRIPKSTDPKTLTLEQCLDIMSKPKKK